MLIDLIVGQSGKDEVQGSADFGAHALLHEGTQLALIVNLDDFLGPIGRVGDVELHLDGVRRGQDGSACVVDL
jgi:hypothetical protein